MNIYSQENPTKRPLLFLVLFFSFVFTFPHLWSIVLGNSDNNQLKEQEANLISVERKDYFSDVVIEAQSAFVYDVNKEEILYEKNSSQQLPLASVTKIMTALIAAETLDTENIFISILPEFLIPEGDIGLIVGERWNLRDLIDVMLVTSSNDTSVAISHAINQEISKIYGAGDHFISAMNSKANELSLSQTYFLNESGLDVSLGVSGGYGSTKDMVSLFSHILHTHPSLLERTRDQRIIISSNVKNHSFINTNRGVEGIPGILASKTGFTDLAGGNLIIAFEAGPGRKIIVSVLGSSVEGRFRDVEELAHRALLSIDR